MNRLLWLSLTLISCVTTAQTASLESFTKDQLIKGVELPLSAMTAHVLLQQSGYTVNPF